MNNKGVAKAIRLTTATAKVAARRSATLRLAPAGTKKTAKGALKRLTSAARQGKKVTATITVRIVDAAGNTRTLKRIVQLTK